LTLCRVSHSGGVLTFMMAAGIIRATRLICIILNNNLLLILMNFHFLFKPGIALY
jgi:hypothetical protein